MKAQGKINRSLFSGFSKLTRQERFEKLIQLGALTQDDLNFFNQNHMPSIELAEKLIENVIGFFPLPLGVAVNFCIDGQDYIIPMAVEETSIIAAASKTAKWICEAGEISTETIGNLSIGQIQIAHCHDYDRLEKIINAEKNKLIAQANTQVTQGLVNRGGGVSAIELRKISCEDGSLMAIIHVLIDTRDAMGANIINQVCEFLKTPIEKLSGETVNMCILSNLNDTRLSRAQISIRNIEADLGAKIEKASRFAEADPYRAATNNKGVLNGMDPILIATGNDWRAVEAGVHAYACHKGQYRSITKWRMQNNELIGSLEAPVMVGIVGGVTKLHPTANICLKMLNVDSADHLARIVAAVGLVQNLGALKALATVGIIEGHMKLHLDNLALSAGANEDETPILKEQLLEILKKTRRVTLGNAIDALQQIREQQSLNTKKNP